MSGDIRGRSSYATTASTVQPGGHRHARPVGFSLGGAYALDMSVTLADEIAAIVTFYATYTGPDYRSAKSAYLGHFAEHDAFEAD